MRTELLTPFVEISAGQSTTIRVEVHNTGTIIDGVTARLVGIDENWVQLPIAITSLFPETAEVIDLKLTLPRTYPAGRHTVALEVRSTIDSSVGAVEQVVLDVAPAEDARLDTTPRSITARKKATFVASIENRGNRPIELVVTAADTVRALSAKITPPTFTIGPGDTVEAEIRMKGRRPFYGAAATRQIVVQANGGEHELESVVRFTQKPVIARGFVTTLILVGIIALWALIFTFAIRFLTSSDDQEKTVHALFITGAEDKDGDGLIGLPTGEDPLGEEGPDAKAAIDIADVAGIIKGAVTAESTGEGISRLTVRAHRNTRDGWRVVASGATDDSGAYELAGLIPGSYRVEFVGSGFVDRWFPTATNEAGAEIQRLEPVGELELVSTVEGQPGSLQGVVLVDTLDDVASPSIVVTAREPTVETPFTTTADANGAFVLTGLPTPGNFEITFSDPDFRNRTVFEPLSGGENKTMNTIKLGAADGSLAGLVTDGTSALGGVTVRLTRGDTVLETTTPTSGGGIGTYLFGELDTPGTFVVTFELDGFSTETQAVDLGPGESRAGFDITLIGGAGSISGQVVDTNNQALPGVVVAVAGSGFATTASTLSAGTPGTYSITDIPTPGAYTLTFSLPGFITETRSVNLGTGGPVTGINMVLTSAVGDIAGTVQVDGSLAGGVNVNVSDGLTILTTTTESTTGAFRFVDLSPGSYTVTAMPIGRDPVVRLVTVTAGGSATVAMVF